MADVSQVVTIDRSRLLERIGALPHEFQRRVDAGLQRALGLDAA